MSKTWILDVLDRELPDLVGAERDRLAEKIVDAMPLLPIAAAICSAAYTQMRVRGEDVKCIELARDIGNNAAMSVLEVLYPLVDEDDACMENR